MSRLPGSAPRLALVARMLGAGALAALALPGAAPAQVPRISPPPPCRLPAGFREPMLNVRLASSRQPTVAVFPFTQGVVERRFTHVPWALAERVRRHLRSQRALSVSPEGVTNRVIFESGGSVDSARSLIGAQWMLVGDVEPAGLDTRVRVRLSRAVADSALWQGSYLLSRFTLGDIERAVALGVAQALKVAPVEPSRAWLPRRGDIDHTFAAADLLLRDHTFEGADTARVLMETAFRVDTSPAVALGVARATAMSLQRGGAVGTQESEARLRRVDGLLDYVLRADSSNAEAWTVRAIAARFRDPEQFTGAVPAHQRAVRLDPQSADAAHEYGLTLMRLGAWGEAGAQFRRALALDPGRPLSLVALAEVEARNDKPALVCALTNAAIAADSFDPRAYGLRALARLDLMQAREAYADAETAARLADTPYARAIRLRVELGSSNVDYARSLARSYVQRYLASPGTFRVRDALALAEALTVAGFPREAITALSRARPVGRELGTGMGSRAFDSLRKDPRFEALVKSIPTQRRLERPDRAP